MKGTDPFKKFKYNFLIIKSTFIGLCFPWFVDRRS